MLPFLFAAPALVQTQADPFSAALGELATKLKAEPGVGAVVMAERRMPVYGGHNSLRFLL